MAIPRRRATAAELPTSATSPPKGREPRAERCDTVAAMMTHTIRAIALSIALCAALAGCMTDRDVEPQAEPATSVQESAVTCTPGYETCDIGCFYDGGPSSDDCIIKCNAAGNAWITLENCGWAQNGTTSASCLNSQPHPICKWN